MSALRKLLEDRRALLVLTALGAVLYAFQAWRFAHSQASVLDEGLYLYKGFLFASGRYVPFQDFGPWSNHMPLSFLIPGWVQVAFGAGLRTGRYFALLLSLATLLGVWLLARRLGYAAASRRPSAAAWGAAAVWAMALNPAPIKIFSQQSSQGLAACLLVWTLVLVAGSGRPAWQVVLGAGLAAAVPLTRINLLPLLPLTLGYIFWERGWRLGLWSGAAAALVFIGGHALFWPGILRMWAPWFPDGLTPFLDPYRRPPNDGSAWNPQVTPFNRLVSLAQGLRAHFVALAAAGGLLLFWPESLGWERARLRVAVFLSALLWSLALLHGWASLGQEYCVFCFPVYLSFFSSIGLVLAAASLPAWDLARRRRWLPPLALVLCGLIGLSLFDTLGARLVQQPLVVQVLKMEVPRSAGPGTIPLWGLIENRFGSDYETIVRGGQYWGRVLVSGAAGLVFGGLLVATAWRWRLEGATIAGRLTLLLLAAGLLLSPTGALGGGYRTYDCTGNVIAAYEGAGEALASALPDGARVYWGTGESPVPLLYLPEVEVLPAQLNGRYSFKQGGDPEALRRHGHWNRALALDWLSQADAALLNPAGVKSGQPAWLFEALAQQGFELGFETGPLHPCSPDSQILIFMRQ